MDLLQFLAQFSFISMAECRRSVMVGSVSIDGRIIRYNDLSKSATEFAKIGSIITIGKRLKHEVKPEHLPT